MRRLVVLIIGIMFLSACGDKEASLPDDILPQPKMQAVLWDIIRADEYVDLQLSFDSSIIRKQKSLELYSSIFAIHKITERSFKRSFAYYQNNPAQLKIVFDSLRKRTERPPIPQVVKPR